MIERKAIGVSLTPELHVVIHELLSTDTYGSASEVVGAGLRLLREQEVGARGHGHGRTDPPSPNQS